MWLWAPALPRDLASRLDRAFGLALEIGTALLVAAEIAILFVGIVARYAFHRPLIWSDELASLLFLWLAMFGAVLALRRGEHMRMTALVNAFPLRSRYFFELLSLAAALAFLGAILLPAFDYAAGESIVSIMSLDISMSWRAAAMPVCVGAARADRPAAHPGAAEAGDAARADRGRRDHRRVRAAASDAADARAAATWSCSSWASWR